MNFNEDRLCNREDIQLCNSNILLLEKHPGAQIIELVSDLKLLLHMNSNEDKLYTKIV